MNRSTPSTTASRAAPLASRNEPDFPVLGNSDSADEASASAALVGAAREVVIPTARKRGVSVALIGADGSGKTTVARQLVTRLSLPATYVYMGSNLEAANWMLPSSWALRQWRRWRGRGNTGGGPPQRQRKKVRGSLPRRMLRHTKSACSLAHRILEQTFRHLVVLVMRMSGRVVVLDRHYYIDYYAFDVDKTADRSWQQRLHGLLLERVFPKPQLVIFLDAPSEVLFARKGEGTIELLEHRRQDYLALGEQFPNFHQIDATQPIDQVVEEVAHCIVDFCGQCR